MTDEEKKDLISLEKWIRSMGLLREANVLRKIFKKEEKQSKEIKELKEKLQDELDDRDRWE